MTNRTKHLDRFRPALADISPVTIGDPRMPLNSMELERASTRLAELRRRLNDGQAKEAADIQREVLLIIDVVTAMLNVLDRTVAAVKRPSR